MSKRTLSLETYLKTLLSRVPETAAAPSQASGLGASALSNALNILGDFLLHKYHAGGPDASGGLTRQGSAKSIRVASEAMQAQNARLSETWENPLEAHSGKILKLTGQTVTNC